MAALKRTPHVVTLTRPSASKGAANDTELDWTSSPALVRPATVHFQVEGGVLSQESDGQVVPFQARLFAFETDFQLNDRIDVALPWHADSYLVVEVAPKTNVRGAYDHTEVSLAREALR